ncbi:uncharacterized protein UHOD_12330 [Ustilago sp. UG-2017b]|nr:uncharacterized protein UHOD_12330 [Ustilago sp. UG-2017b]
MEHIVHPKICWQCDPISSASYSFLNWVGSCKPGVRGLAPETQVGLSGYSATIKLRDDSGWRLCVLTDAWSDPRTAVDYCLRFYLNPDRWFAMNCLRTSVITSLICVTSDAAPVLSPESTFFIEYCAGGPSSATPVLLSCVASFDTAPPPQDLLASLLYTAPPPSTGDGPLRGCAWLSSLMDLVLLRIIPAHDNGHSGKTEPVQEDMDLRPYQQHMDSDHEDEQDDDDDEGNVPRVGSQKKTTIAGLGMVEQEARGLAGTGSRNGRSATSMESAVSMETMDTED